MGNSYTPHSKKLRAETAKIAMRKRRTSPDFRQFAIGGDATVINHFIAHLDATGESTRIQQLEAINNKLDQQK